MKKTIALILIILAYLIVASNQDIWPFKDSFVLQAQVKIEDNNLILITPDGSEELLLEDVNEKIYIGEDSPSSIEYFDFYVRPYIYSFSEKYNKVYLCNHIDGTEIIHDVFEFDIESGSIKKTDLPGDYRFSYTHITLKSPDGTRVALIGEGELRIFDLMENKEIFRLHENNTGGALLAYPTLDKADHGTSDLLRWVDNNNLEYPIYKSTDKDRTHSLLEVKRLKI